MNISKKVGAGLGTFTAGIGSAMAAVDVSVTTALSDAATDVGTIGSAVLVALVAAAAFKYVRRAL